MVAVIAIYFLVWTIKVLDATTLVSNANVSIIPVTQWCDTPEAVNKIIRDFKRPTHKTLLEYGCHWVPKFIPVEGIIEEINNIWLEKLSRDKKRLQIEKSLFSNEDFGKILTSAILSVTLNNIRSVHDYYRTVRNGK